LLSKIFTTVKSFTPYYVWGTLTLNGGGGNSSKSCGRGGTLTMLKKDAKKTPIHYHKRDYYTCFKDT
jgi:hypothetical protein